MKYYNQNSYNTNQILEYPRTINRQLGLPLSLTSVWDSLDNLKSYAADTYTGFSGSAYAGEIVSVAGTTSSDISKAYIINNDRKCS